MKIILNDFPKISLNSIYAGIHWAKRKKIKDDYSYLIKSYMQSNKIVYPLKGKFLVTYNFFFKSRPLDPTNCAFMIKMIEDCIFDKDSFKYMSIGKIASHKSKEQKKDYVVIEIYIPKPKD